MAEKNDQPDEAEIERMREAVAAHDRKQAEARAAEAEERYKPLVQLVESRRFADFRDDLSALLPSAHDADRLQRLISSVVSGLDAIPAAVQHGRDQATALPPSA
jgi:hypothetical protein